MCKNKLSLQLAGKEVSVCVWGGMLGEKWAGHLVVTGGPGQGGHAEEEGLLYPASRLKIHFHQYPACPVPFALESGNPGFFSLSSKLGATPVSTAGQWALHGAKPHHSLPPEGAFHNFK